MAADRDGIMTRQGLRPDLTYGRQPAAALNGDGDTELKSHKQSVACCELERRSTLA